MRTLLGAAAVLVLLVVPISVSGTTVESAAQQPMANPALKKKLKKLRKQVRTLKREAATVQQRLGALEGELGASRPPAGPAGGDLTGDYPNPQIAANAVGAAEVAPDALTGADVAEQTLFNDNSLTGVDVDESTLFNDNSLTGNDVNEGTLFNDNSLTGADINESSLSQVPSADQANNAQTVDGRSLATFNFNLSANSTQTLFNFGGLTLTAECAGAGGEKHILLYADTDTDNSYLHATIDGATSDPDLDMIPGHDLLVFDSNQDKGGLILYRRGPGPGVDAQVTSVTLAYHTDPGTGNHCQMPGTVVGH